jgi:hypothetical protein
MIKQEKFYNMNDMESTHRLHQSRAGVGLRGSKQKSKEYYPTKSSSKSD